MKNHEHTFDATSEAGMMTMRMSALVASGKFISVPRMRREMKLGPNASSTMTKLTLSSTIGPLIETRVVSRMVKVYRFTRVPTLEEWRIDGNATRKAETKLPASDVLL
jgi:hypothetical protein